MNLTDDEIYRKFLDWRGIVTPCPKCRGTGIHSYDNTTTWHGGIGGQVITSAVCDKCWGSGDVEYPWTDLRKLYREMISLKKSGGK